MTLDKEGRLFVGWTGIVGIVRRIEQTERSVPAGGGKFDGFDRGEIVGDAQVRAIENVGRFLEDPVSAGLQVELDDAGRKGRRPSKNTT